MTIAELLTEFERYLKKYPKKSGEKPLVVQADVDDGYFAVIVRNLLSAEPPHVAFERVGFGETMSVYSVKAALEGIANNTEVFVTVGATRYSISGVAAHNKQAVILLTQKC